MPIHYSIISLLLLLLFILFGFYLAFIFRVSSIWLFGTIVIGPILAVFFSWRRFINYKIKKSYLALAEVTGGQVFESKFLSKPKLIFEIDKHQCEIVFDSGSKSSPSITILKSKLKSNIRFYAYRGDVVRTLENIGLEFPDIKVGDNEFDECFRIESKHQINIRKIFSGDTLGYIKKIMNHMDSMRLDENGLSFSIYGELLSNEKYEYLIESFKACLVRINACDKED